MGEVRGIGGARLPWRELVVRLPSPAAPFEDAVDRPARPDDTSFMAEALRLAARIPRRPWPNPPVGAVVVREGEVVGRGAHHGAGTDHAEVVALRQAGQLAQGATLYCTLEPCNHQGRTPPCAPLVARSGITRLVVAVADPNPNVCGGGLARVRDAGIDVQVGVMGDEALDLIWPFVTTRAFERPFVLLKTAMSLDGFFAPPPDSRRPGEPAYLTSLDARRDVHRLRRWSDVVAVGAQTMALDRPRLDGRLVDASDPCPTIEPIPSYVDTDLSLQEGWPGPHWVFAGIDAASFRRQRGIERLHGTVVLCEQRDGRVSPQSLVAQFRHRGGYCLMVEGGPTLAAAFLDAGVVDRWVSYVAPVVLGAGIGWPAGVPQWPGQLTRTERIGPDEKRVYDRTPFHDTLTGPVGNGLGID